MPNPFKRLTDWLEWRRRDREETFVASSFYTVDWVDGQREATGDQTVLICSFYVDGNGTRYSSVSRPNTPSGKQAFEQHNGLRKARYNWENFGDLPQSARRPCSMPEGKIVLIRAEPSNG